MPNVAAICYYHLQHLCQIWRHVSQEVTTRLVLAMVMSRLNSCNAAQARLLQATVAPLQWFPNSVARWLDREVQHLWARHSMSATVTLAIPEMLVCPVQTVLHHAFSLLWDVSSVSDEHSRVHRWQPDTFWPSTDVVSGLDIATAMHKVQWTCVLTRCSRHMEHTA